MRERTYELTNYCPHECSYCSTSSVSVRNVAVFLDARDIRRDLEAEGPFDRIILSGGEPLAHQDFYDILVLCQQHAPDVVIYSNAIRHLIYNAHVIDGVTVEANLTLHPDTEKLHILKRVRHGREATRPEVSLSRNYESGHACEPCDHVVIRPNGSRAKPCDKP